MVIGPTPPGTGVMAPAFATATLGVPPRDSGVTFHVTLGPEAKVGSVNLEGDLKPFTEAELIKEMRERGVHVMAAGMATAATTSPSRRERDGAPYRFSSASGEATRPWSHDP